MNIKMGLREPYLMVNTALAGVIIIIMIYSGIFSPETNNYPVECVHEKVTGQQCVSCGLSHSFSLIIRGKIYEAYAWNSYGLRIFLFFAGQLIMRILFSKIYLARPDSRKQLIIYDIAGSSVLFLIAFMPFLVYIFRFS